MRYFCKDVHFSNRFILGSIGVSGVLIRLQHSKRGLSITNRPKLFSERYGYRKSFQLVFGWRVILLEARE